MTKAKKQKPRFTSKATTAKGKVKAGSKPRVKNRGRYVEEQDVKDKSGRYYVDETGLKQLLPPFQQFVSQLWLYGYQRHEIVGQCIKLYGCSASTADRGIRNAKEGIIPDQELTALQASAQAQGRLDIIVQRVFNAVSKSGNTRLLGIARMATVDKMRVRGELAKDKSQETPLTGTPEQMQKQADDALRASQAALERAQAQDKAPAK